MRTSSRNASTFSANTSSARSDAVTRGATNGRASVRTAVIVSTVLLAAALLLRLRHGGGPYTTRPATVVDHVGPLEHPIRPALVLLPRIATQIPHGTTVTCFRPHDGESWDDGEMYLAALSMLGDHRVRPPLTTHSTDKPQYVIAIGGPFTDRAYREISRTGDALLYEIAR